MYSLHGSEHFPVFGLNLSSPSHILNVFVQLSWYCLQSYGSEVFTQFLQSHSGMSQGCIHPAVHWLSHSFVFVLKCFPLGHSSLCSKVSLMQIK